MQNKMLLNSHRSQINIRCQIYTISMVSDILVILLVTPCVQSCTEINVTPNVQQITTQGFNSGAGYPNYHEECWILRGTSGVSLIVDLLHTI